ncbi:hypothetical protein [Pseudoalteromonas sp. bablab_jr011]|uniref:hypothetical protein n=1 Tax=Pseudoalteromonas sp. bablab_jr011 TaxID=2755062 RepID=UPI0018F7B4D9|nr:hypothetical protein [Pseudoalteromonas sp. bablab_jr011]
MKNILKSKLAKAGLVVTSVLAAGAAHAEAAAEVTAATTSFQTFFTDNANLIGGVMLLCAFVAIGWKWIKGMSFS